jgi:Bacterial Ig-like domain (group 2)
VPLAYTVRDSKQNPVRDIDPSWSSTNEKAATVTSQGVVTSVGRGNANIVARIGDVQGAAEVAVDIRPIARVELRPATALGRVHESQRFQVTAYGPDGIPIPEVAALYTSSDPAVATVDASGVASCHKAGAATIRVELAGAKAEATLLVN